MNMIAELKKLGKGVMINGIPYVTVILNSVENDLDCVYINIKCNPDKMLGKEVNVLINKDCFIQSPIEENKKIFLADDVKLA